MGFYLETNEDTIYISDSYLQSKLIHNNKGGLTKASAVTSENEKLLKKIGYTLEIVKEDDLINSLIDRLTKNNMNDYSILTTFTKTHLLVIAYLLYEGRINDEGLQEILFSTNYSDRSEILVSYLTEIDTEEVDIFKTLKSKVRKMSNIKNKYEMASTGVTYDSVTTQLRNNRMLPDITKVSLGGYYYHIKTCGAGNTIYKYCDYWMRNW